MKIIQSILTRNPCYTGGRKLAAVKGLMLHSVGCPQPSAAIFVSAWNSPQYTAACVHGFIDANSGDVYQCLPWDHRAWHCASGAKGSGNNTHIGIEMCEPACISYSGIKISCSNLSAARAAVKRTYDSAVELFAMLCNQYRLDPLADGVIISHREGCLRGIASNHGDPEHLWNYLGTGYTMDTFRKAVHAAMGAGNTATPSKPENAATGQESTCRAAYVVRIKIPDLNIRTGPGTTYPSKGYITPGAYTVTEESPGPGAKRWGKLKSGVGWIALDFTEKV